MKNKLVASLLALSCTTVLGASNKEETYPSGNIAQFVAQKLDLTSLPAAFRLKKEKGKKTLADYKFEARSANGNDAEIIGLGGARSLVIRVLDHNASEVYVCVSKQENSGTSPDTQSVVRLKWKDHGTLLKGYGTSREFAACPSVGIEEPSTGTY